MRNSFFILLITLFSFSCKQTAEKFYNAGVEKMHKKPESGNGKPSRTAVEAQLRAALIDFDEAIKMDSNYLKAYESRLWVRLALKDKSGCLADAEKLSSLEPKSAWVYDIIGQNKNDLKDYTGAIKAYGQAIALDPKNADYYSSRADTEEQLTENDAALKDYDQAIAIAPNGPSSNTFFLERGLLKLKMKDNSGCIDLQKAKSLGDETAQTFIDTECK